jgi:EmrB/QacA subfamily drug resistance transporter
MAALDTLVVSTALSTIRVHLGASVAQLEWTVNAYNLSFAVLLITGSALGDRFGRRRLYAAGLGLFAVSSAACALAPDVGWLIAARAAQGAGSALLMPVGLALLSAAFPPEKRGAAIGIFSAITGLAVASGPLVGGAVVQGISWEWIFWLNVPIGLLAIPFVLSKLRESFGADTALDGRGLGLVTVGAFGIVWGLVRGNSAGWGSVEVIAALVLGCMLVAWFVVWERRAPAPMLPTHLFRSRSFSAGNAAIFFTFASLFGAVFFVAQLMQTGLGYGPLGTGLRLLPWTATFMTVAPIAGAMADRIGERPLMVSGLALQAAGLAWLALIAKPGLAYTSLLAPFIVAGVGVSMAIPSAQNSVLASVSMETLGKAAGANSMMRELGGRVRRGGRRRHLRGGRRLRLPGCLH